MDLLDVLSFAVVSVLLATLITLRNTDRKILSENITQERAKWESKIRLKYQLALTRRPFAPAIQEQVLPCESATIAEATFDQTIKDEIGSAPELITCAQRGQSTSAFLTSER